MRLFSEEHINNKCLHINSRIQLLLPRMVVIEMKQDPTPALPRHVLSLPSVYGKTLAKE